MKRYLFLCAIFISACSSNSTSPPPVNAPAHPFPDSFSQIAVTFKNLPQHWETHDNEYDVVQHIDVTSNDSGSNNSFSSSWNFYFNKAAFHKSGDTLRAPGLMLVADQATGILSNLSVAYSHDTDYRIIPRTQHTSYGLSCQNITYTTDSLAKKVTISGAAVQAGLKTLKSDNSDDLTYSSHGYSRSNSNTYKGTALDSSSLTIRFIP